MPDVDEVWVYVASDGHTEAHTTQEAAQNAARDDPGDVWIEHTILQTATGADLSDETTLGDQPGHPTPQTGAQRRRTWIGPATYTNPSGDAA